MTTHETFSEVYATARDIFNGDADSSPVDPVIRLEDGAWILESSLTPAENAELEISLNSFDCYFFDGYDDSDYTPTESEMYDYIAYIKHNTI